MQMDRTNIAVCFSPVLFHINVKKNQQLFSKSSSISKQVKSTPMKDDLGEVLKFSNEKFIVGDMSPQQKINGYVRKCSTTFNKAAISIANISATLTESSYNRFNGLSDKNIDELSKVAQTCLSDMIKFSADLFTVTVAYCRNKHVN